MREPRIHLFNDLFEGHPLHGMALYYNSTKTANPHCLREKKTSHTTTPWGICAIHKTKMKCQHIATALTICLGTPPVGKESVTWISSSTPSYSLQGAAALLQNNVWSRFSNMHIWSRFSAQTWFCFTSSVQHNIFRCPFTQTCIYFIPSLIFSGYIIGIYCPSPSQYCKNVSCWNAPRRLLNIRSSPVSDTIRSSNERRNLNHSLCKRLHVVKFTRPLRTSIRCRSLGFSLATGHVHGFLQAQ